MIPEAWYRKESARTTLVRVEVLLAMLTEDLIVPHSHKQSLTHHVNTSYTIRKRLGLEEE